MVKIALDAGHGLKTGGKQTPDGIKEWTLNDKVRDKVVSILSEYDAEIIHTDNDEGNVDESLSSRLNKYINAGVAAFVSIHHNAYTGTWNNATGVEVFVDKNNTEADQRLAECVYNRLVKYTGLRGRGIKKENWYVINQNRIPAILCEGGFMDGSNDYKVITSAAGQEAYAKAVAEGLIEFLGLKKKPVTSTPENNNTAAVKVNDVVSIIGNATYYNGTPVPGWVKNTKWIVSSVKGNRAVIDKSEDGQHSICSPIDVKYLTVTKSSGNVSAPLIVSVNSVVSISSNATYYNGKPVPSWVKSKRWIVSSIKGDRAVIDKSEDGKNSICSPINVKYLTVVK